MRKIIYRLSDSADYGFQKGSNTWYRVRHQLDNNEHYLFREVWRLNEYDLDNMYEKKIEDNFIKVVNDDWIKKHTVGSKYIEYYGCTVLKDYEPYEDYENCIATEYDQEIHNL